MLRPRVQSIDIPYCEGRLCKGSVWRNWPTINTADRVSGDERSGDSLQTQDEADQSDQLPRRVGLWAVPEGDRLNRRPIQYVKRSWSGGTRIALSVEEGFCGLAWGLMGRGSEWLWAERRGRELGAVIRGFSGGGGGSNREGVRSTLDGSQGSAEEAGGRTWRCNCS